MPLSVIRNEIEVNAMQDALMNHRAASRLPHVDGSEWEETGMIQAERNDMVGFAPRPERVVHRAEYRCASHWKPLRLTISLQKIDLVLAEIQKEVENLLEEMMVLRLVRTQLAD
jgi:hypothetical protein